MVVLFAIERICNCELIPNHATGSLKNPDAVLVRYAMQQPYQTNHAPFLLSASICFNLPL